MTTWNALARPSMALCLCLLVSTSKLYGQSIETVANDADFVKPSLMEGSLGSLTDRYTRLQVFDPTQGACWECCRTVRCYGEWRTTLYRVNGPL